MLTWLGSYEINLPYYGRGKYEEWFVWRDKLIKALDDQNISTGPQRYMFTDRLFIGDAKSTFPRILVNVLLIISPKY